MATVWNLACIAFCPEGLDVHGYSIQVSVYNILFFFLLNYRILVITWDLWNQIGCPSILMTITIFSDFFVFVRNIHMYLNKRVMPGSFHIRSVLIGVEYRNSHWTLDVYLCFAIWKGPIQSKVIYIFVTYGLASL